VDLTTPVFNGTAPIGTLEMNGTAPIGTPDFKSLKLKDAPDFHWNFNPAGEVLL
tara:strand:+ start:5044 stop:5205 length:162 start_codon:yes stop_codon:yes gene_type:complete